MRALNQRPKLCAFSRAHHFCDRVFRVCPLIWYWKWSNMQFSQFNVAAATQHAWTLIDRLISCWMDESSTAQYKYDCILIRKLLWLFASNIKMNFIGSHHRIAKGLKRSSHTHVWQERWKKSPREKVHSISLPHPKKHFFGLLTPLNSNPSESRLGQTTADFSSGCFVISISSRMAKRGRLKRREFTRFFFCRFITLNNSHFFDIYFFFFLASPRSTHNMRATLECLRSLSRPIHQSLTHKFRSRWESHPWVWLRAIFHPCIGRNWTLLLHNLAISSMTNDWAPIAFRSKFFELFPSSHTTLLLHAWQHRTHATSFSTFIGDARERCCVHLWKLSAIALLLGWKKKCAHTSTCCNMTLKSMFSRCIVPTLSRF